MEIFEVEKGEFANLETFNNHLAERVADDLDSDLYIITSLSQYSKTEFYELLRQHGYDFEDYGEIQKISREYDLKSDDSKTAQFYHYYDEQQGIGLFYSDQRKTEEIESTILKFLANEVGVYYLSIGPTLFRDIRNTIKSNEAFAEITEFVADRNDESDFPCRIRPQYGRTINYYGDDGYATLEEMEENYGVKPRYIQFNIPNQAKFKITRDGVFALNDGDLSTLFDYIEVCIRKSLALKEAFDGSSFQMVSTTDQLSVPTSEPATIKLSGSLEYNAVEGIKSQMEDEGYLLVDSFQQEGSLYLSTKVFDKQKENVFRIKASGDEIRVFPQDEGRTLGSFLRFHEFIQNHVDPNATVEPVA